MGIGEKIRSIVIGYFVIGTLIGLTQLGLTKLFEPPCNDGRVEHILWRDYGWRIIDITEDLRRPLPGEQAKHAEPPMQFYFRIGRGLARWLPDLYREVITGEMKVRDYLLGGYQCVETPRTMGVHLSRCPQMVAVGLPLGDGCHHRR